MYCIIFAKQKTLILCHIPYVIPPVDATALKVRKIGFVAHVLSDRAIKVESRSVMAFLCALIRRNNLLESGSQVDRGRDRAVNLKTVPNEKTAFFPIVW